MSDKIASAEADEAHGRSLIANCEIYRKETCEDDSRTIGEFCDIEGISRSTYFKMRRLGFGPDETRVPGTKIVRITPETHRKWRARMQALAHEEAAKLEAQRRRTQAAVAGKLSALHASARKPTPAVTGRRGRKRKAQASGVEA